MESLVADAMLVRPLRLVPHTIEEEEHVGGSLLVDELRYWFYVLGPRPYKGNPYQQALADNLTTFGRDLGSSGKVVRAYDEAANRIRDEVAALDWPNELGTQMAESIDPFMLVVAGDLKRPAAAPFDPRSERWALIWFADDDAEKVHRVFTDLARRTRGQEDLLGHLTRIEVQVPSGRWAKRVLGAIQLKPEIPFLGVSIDIKALIAGD